MSCLRSWTHSGSPSTLRPCHALSSCLPSCDTRWALLKHCSMQCACILYCSLHAGVSMEMVSVCMSNCDAYFLHPAPVEWAVLLLAFSRCEIVSSSQNETCLKQVTCTCPPCIPERGTLQYWILRCMAHASLSLQLKPLRVYCYLCTASVSCACLLHFLLPALLRCEIAPADAWHSASGMLHQV